eukprot:m.182561 g.182561  ORF g.182561 m.182561 type:complete len:568 (-) comp32121_c0_seq2:67-1770(-)
MKLKQIPESGPAWENVVRQPRHTIGMVAGGCGIAGVAAAIAYGSIPIGVMAVVGTWAVGTLVRGPRDSTLSALIPISRPRVKFGGTCAKGYEKVEAAFRRHFHCGLEGGAQCTAYVHGEVVVDLWGVREGSQPEHFEYDGTSLVNVFSSTKVMESLTIAMLVDRGHVRYEDKLSDIWPEFSQHGKESITVAELMRHEGALPWFDAPVTTSAATTDSIKAGALSDLIASTKPKWPRLHEFGSKWDGVDGGHRRQYHPLTRGWIANEIAVRVDPQHRTIGEFVKQEIMAPLKLTEASEMSPNRFDFVIGLPESDHHRVAPLTGETSLTTWSVMQSFLMKRHRLTDVPPWWLFGWPLFWLAFQIVQPFLPFFWTGSKPIVADEDSGAPLGKTVAEIFNDARVRKMEIPSANGHANAATMAAVMNVIAAGGERDGVRLLSHDGYEKAMQGGVIDETFFGLTTEFTNAGWHIYNVHPEKSKGGRSLPPRRGFVGWQGIGGSVMQFHPDLDISFGYAMTEMLPFLDPNVRSWRLQKALLECVERRTHAQEHTPTITRAHSATRRASQIAGREN